MSVNWEVVRQEHIHEACRLYDIGEKTPLRPSRNTFLLYNQKRYPAKFIRGLAYEIATGHTLDPSRDYAGGYEAVQFFKKLGYSTEYKGETVHGIHDTLTIEPIIEHTSNLLAQLQEAYRIWAQQFKSQQEVFMWLQRKGIKTERCRTQGTFNLLSSHWNCITKQVLYTVCPDILTQLGSSIGNILHNTDQTNMAQMWYLLYFLHPVRHELFYFDAHYPHGYHSRVTKLIRSHRQGLKALRTRCNRRESISLHDRTIKACATTAFKHVYLHPTTSTWGTSQETDVLKTLKSFKIGENHLTSDEKNVVLALSTLAIRSRTDVMRWIHYAPCAINEGPIFRLRDKKTHSACFEAIVHLLQDDMPTQQYLRDVLTGYYVIIQ